MAQDVGAFRTQLLAEKGDPAQVLIEVSDMRRRITEAKKPTGPWDTRLGAGRLQQIELIAQASSLMTGNTGRDVASGLSAGVAISWLDDADRAALMRAYALCWQVQQVARLLGDKPLDPPQIGAGGTSFVLRETGYTNIGALQQALETTTAEASTVIDHLLARPPREI